MANIENKRWEYFTVRNMLEVYVVLFKVFRGSSYKRSGGVRSQSVIYEHSIQLIYSKSAFFPQHKGNKSTRSF